METNHLSAFLVLIPTFISRQFSLFRSSILHMIRMPSNSPCNRTVIAVTIPLQMLLSFLQLKNDDLFLTHPKTMHLAVSTTVGFYLAYLALLRFSLGRSFDMIADHCLFSVGIASVASSASLLLPDSYAPFVFAGFGSLSAADLLRWFGRDDAGRLRVSRFFNIVIRHPQPILPLWIKKQSE